MNDPNQLRSVLRELLNDIAANDGPAAMARASALIANLSGHDNATPLHHAILGEARAAEAHMATGNWTAAAQAIKTALNALPQLA